MVGANNIAEVNNIQLAYLDEGEGEVVLLLHGFASSARINWGSTGWVDMLVNEGYRVIAVDHRGHGNSTKLYDPYEYEASMMASDAKALLDLLSIEQAHVIGYSMGARVAAFMGMNYPAVVKTLTFSGMASALVTGVGGAMTISHALLADHIDEVTDPIGKRFRLFAEKTGSDLKALAACIKITRIKIKGEALARLTMPVLVAAGTEDDISGDPEELKGWIKQLETLIIEGKDHMTAVGAKAHLKGVLAFIKGY